MGIKTDEICSCLFLKRHDNIVVVQDEGEQLSVLSFYGETKQKYSEDFWKTWKQVVSFTEDQLTDFCLIGDEPVSVPDDLKSVVCNFSDSRWNLNNICKALKEVNTDISFEIYDENERCIAQKDGIMMGGQYEKLYIYTPVAEMMSTDVSDKQGEIQCISNDNKYSFAYNNGTEPTEFAEYFIHKLEDDERRRLL